MEKGIHLIFLGLLTAFAVSILAGSQDLKFADEYSFGPGFVPVVIATLMLVCCVIQAIRLVRATPAEAAEDRSKLPPNLAGLALAIAIIGFGVASMSLGSVFGPVAAILLLISWGVTRHPLPISLFVSASTTALLYLIFSVWLGLPIT
ncbi:tripartite tricarboxylate transporter TctB family protein [Hoeflea olei]|uniref:DUF1468 domain-containing protein n=1 Tax=Hoeflea olei TaxID=1480615 RepID=A0A1C1Z1L0_9HYPH|nr:tripartite tricarboxylate transporter TctB family protein [Hoeflea olei]OCW59610.1 hypothetical protein AWJ14_11455 [Hoeflea olei]